MTNYCLFTITHPNAKRIYIRGVADITEPIDEYDKIIEFYEGSELKNSLPKNPHEKGTEDFNLFKELLISIKSRFEDIGDELVFADFIDGKHSEWHNHFVDEDFIIDMEKITIKS